ncbi:DDE family transposase [Acetobacter aceti NBRC 14818]|nr:DDE family transposase [Acetobacter aceti NBRC 14818]
MSDFKGADILLSDLPDKTEEVIGDRGYDSNKIRLSLADRNIIACIPPKKNRKSKPPYDWHLYKKRHLIENMFAKLKDWRRVATRYVRCAHTFMSAIHIAASFIFWLLRALVWTTVPLGLEPHTIIIRLLEEHSERAIRVLSQHHLSLTEQRPVPSDMHKNSH